MKTRYATSIGDPIGELELDDARYALEIYEVHKILDKDTHTDARVFSRAANMMGFRTSRLREIATVIKVMEALK